MVGSDAKEFVWVAIRATILPQIRFAQREMPN